MKVVIISPVRDEAEFIGTTIQSMINQTLLPTEWIIVNDGSKDDTENIIKEFMNKARFIRYIYAPDRGYRKPGQGVVETFYVGFKKMVTTDYDVIAKLDGDLQLPPYTLERICNEFIANPKLGITGATRYERLKEKGDFKRVLVPKGFVGGPNKFYKRQCFEDIGGLIPRAGWDGVDVIKANMKGWETREIQDLKIIHLRSTGTSTGEGLKRASEKDGDISYYMGGYLWYFALHALGRSLWMRNPWLGYYMLKGYLKSKRNNSVRESDEFRKFLKKKQLENMVDWARQALRYFIKN